LFCHNTWNLFKASPVEHRIALNGFFGRLGDKP
jgi:hypothetical protein